MRILWGIFLSLLIHIMLTWGAQYAVLLIPKKPKIDTVEIKILNQPLSQKETKQIVRDSTLPEKLKVKESEDPLSFLSRQTQRVKKQSQALLSGMTANRANQPENQKTKQNKTRSQTQRPKDFDAFAPGYRKIPEIAEQPKMDKGVSTIGEALPKEVSVGSFTALNTDRYLYYSFFARVEELIRFRWESAVQQTINYTSPARLATNVQGVWNTQLQVIINATGEIKAIKIMKESGLQGFDQSAVQAFVQSRTLPNPPKEMIEEDGLIRLDYAFQVRYSPRALVRSRE